MHHTIYSSSNILKLSLYTFSIAFIMLGFLSCNSDTSMDDKDLCNNNPNCRTITVGEETRDYHLHIPSSYDPDSATPLLINFHGFGGTAESFISETGEGSASLNTVADANNFIVVYPQGVERTKGDAEWDPGDNGESSILNNDVFFVEKLIEEISSEWNINALKIYASGYSNGGMMAYGLACNSAHIFAAIGVMSGTMLEDNCDLSEQTSIIIFHGIDDGVLPYNGNQDFQSVPTVLDFWLDHNDLPSSEILSTTFNDGDVEQDIYADDTRNLSVTLYTINAEFDKPGGHVWFSGTIDGKLPNAILWDFLNAHSLDD